MEMVPLMFDYEIFLSLLDYNISLYDFTEK